MREFLFDDEGYVRFNMGYTNVFLKTTFSNYTISLKINETISYGTWSKNTI
jgi:hypothetical protein